MRPKTCSPFDTSVSVLLADILLLHAVLPRPLVHEAAGRLSSEDYCILVEYNVVLGLGGLDVGYDPPGACLSHAGREVRRRLICIAGTHYPHAYVFVLF